MSGFLPWTIISIDVLPDILCCIQLLAKALGGEVGKNPSGDFVLTGDGQKQTC